MDGEKEGFKASSARTARVNTYLNFWLILIIGEGLLLTKSNEKVHINTGIAVFIGMCTETLFLFLARSLYNLFSPLFDPPAFSFSIAIVILGTFFTGIIVGFLACNKKHAAALGFIAALIPSCFYALTFFSGIGPGPSPLLLFIPFLVLPFLDVAAAVGSAWGSTITTKTFLASTVTVLLLSSLGISGSLFVMPARLSGNLVVKTNEVYNITSSDFVQEGNITVKDNATLSIKNCKFTSNQEYRSCGLEIENQGHLKIENSTLSIITQLYGNPHASFTIYVRDNASAIIENSEIISHELVASQNAHVESINSKWDYGPITTQDNSEVIIINSSVESAIYLGQSSSVHFRNSTTPSYTCSDNARLSIENSNKKANYVNVHGYIHCSGDCNISLTKSTIDGVFANGFKGVIISNNSLIDEVINVQNDSDFFLSGNLTITGKIQQFNWDIKRTYNTFANPYTQLNVTNQNTRKLLWKGESDQNGLATFEVMFMARNYTQQLSLNNQVPFNLTSTTPLNISS